MSAQIDVLFICKANVCRSPLMELVLRDLLPGGEWSIGSRGTQVPPETRNMCPVGAVMAGVGVSAHTPAPVTLENLEQSRLIIAASRAERAAVAAMAPDIRSRTFTLREAVLLGSRSPDAEEWQVAASVGAVESRVEGYAAVLHYRRGLLDIAVPRRRFLPWGANSDPLDFRDVHGAKPGVHRAVLREVAEHVGVLGERLGADLMRAS